MAGLRRSVKAAAMRFERFRPMPEFDSPDNPRWVLPRRILEAWIRTSPTPVLVIPIPHYFFLQSPTASLGYRARLRELSAATGCHLYDPLPDLLRLSTDERSELWSDSSGHLSIRGHQTLANLFVPVLQAFMPAAHAQRAAQ